MNLSTSCRNRVCFFGPGSGLRFLRFFGLGFKHRCCRVSWGTYSGLPWVWVWVAASAFSVFCGLASTLTSSGFLCLVPGCGSFGSAAEPKPCFLLLFFMPLSLLSQRKDVTNTWLMDHMFLKKRLSRYVFQIMPETLCFLLELLWNHHVFPIRFVSIWHGIMSEIVCLILCSSFFKRVQE